MHVSPSLITTDFPLRVASTPFVLLLRFSVKRLTAAPATLDYSVLEGGWETLVKALRLINNQINEKYFLPATAVSRPLRVTLAPSLRHSSELSVRT